MPHPFSHYQESAQAIARRLGGFTPQVALVLGSGLGDLAQEVEHPVTIPYGEIPHLRPSTAPGHQGQLVVGTLAGQQVAVMQGRMHHYEGYSYEEVGYPLRVLRLLGCRTLMVTNAAGCVRPDWKAGEIMLLTDHIKLGSESPLRGENLPQFGPRFPDATHLYTPQLQSLARRTAGELGLTLREGVYFYAHGPQYETPAEVRAIRLLGGDAVGMSTVPEVLVAAHCGMEVLGFSLLSNLAAGMLDQPLTEQEVLQAGQAARPHFSALVLGCLNRLPNPGNVTWR
ncbi:MAG TPA: purine-nucleoside phosphorylase [Clostridiales bacterium]|nr:purine-nucleoside phosphorylase [Clostridiales bacterium]